MQFGMFMEFQTRPDTSANDAFAEGLEMVQIAGLTIPITIVGAGAAFVCFDLEMITGFFHYALYLVVTIGLRFAMGLALLPGLVG